MSETLQSQVWGPTCTPIFTYRGLGDQVQLAIAFCLSHETCHWACNPHSTVAWKACCWGWGDVANVREWEWDRGLHETSRRSCSQSPGPDAGDTGLGLHSHPLEA